MLLRHRVKLNNKGMSLLEVMIAMLFLMVVSMALMQTSIIGFQANLRNSLRGEAARIGDQAIGDLRARAYTQTVTDPLLNSGITTTTVTRNLRSFQTNYSVKTTITDISTNNKQLAVEIKWNFRGSDYLHVTSAILGRK